MLERPARGAADLHEVFGALNGAPKEAAKPKSAPG
jgi:hypothetical protein